MSWPTAWPRRTSPTSGRAWHPISPPSPRWPNSVRRRRSWPASPRITGRASAVPLPTRILLGLALVTCIGLLVAAALGRRYRLAARTGVAGCIGMAMLDLVLITGVTFAVTSVTWVTVTAMAASTVRIAVIARALRPVLAR